MLNYTTKKTFLGLSLLTLTLTISLVSCEETDYAVVEADKANIRLYHSEKLLSAADEQALKNGHQKIREEIPGFYSTYFEEMLGLGAMNTDTSWTFLRPFLDYSLTQESQGRIEEVFADFDDTENALELAFGRYQALFPEEHVPQVVTMNSVFNYGIYPMDSVLAIGLEFYLGEKDTVIKRLPIEQFPAYLREKMNPEQLVPNAMSGWMLVHFKDKGKGMSLLDQMVYQGKIYYFSHLLLPDIPEHLLYAYSIEEMKWCRDNEFNIWQTIVKEDVLFSKDKKLIRDWIGHGPFSRGFGEQSPAPLAPFVGERMVKDYVDQHPDLSAQQLLDIDAKEILQSYKPRN